MSFRCPLCGEEYQMKQIPQEYKTVRCGKCGQVFSIADLPSGAMEKQMGNPAAPVGSPAEAQVRTEEENAPRPTVQNPDNLRAGDGILKAIWMRALRRGSLTFY